MSRLSSTVLRNPVHFIAFGLGSGLAPVAPGTVGTLAAIPPYLLLMQLSLPAYLLVLLLAFAIGVYVCGRTARDLGVEDHGGMVWDEFVGFWVTMVMAPSVWWAIPAGFLLFRLFDISKPFPIGWLDRQVKGGMGVMLDDVVAGMFSCGCLQLMQVAFTH